MSDKEKMVEIFTGTSIDVEILKTVFADHGIASYVKDGLVGTIVPFQAAGGGAGSVKLTISSADLDAALPVLEEYKKNLKDD